MRLFEISEKKTPMNRSEFSKALRSSMRNFRDIEPDVFQKAYELYLKNVAMTPSEAYEMAKNYMDNMAFEQKEEPTSGDRNIALYLPRGDMKVLKAEDKDYDRGLLVKLLDDGGYDMAYWYEKHVPFEVEVLVDGKSIKKDAKIVTMKFHPELKHVEDKVTKFKLYDIEADLNDLKDKVERLQNESIKETIEFQQDLDALLNLSLIHI